MNILYLTRKDVIATGITLADAVDTAEKVLLEHSRGQFQNPPKPSVFMPGNNFFNAMPAYLPGLEMVGVKWLGVFANNRSQGLPSLMGLVILNDVHTGEPLAIVDCGYITVLRTAGASAVAAKHLANKDSQVMGVVGAGEQARFHLMALKEVLPELDLVKVYDVNQDASRQYASDMGEATGCRILIAPSAEAAIREADVVVTATGNLAGKPPVFMEEWLKNGVHVIPVHNFGWELSALENADKFVVDDWKQYSTNFPIDKFNPHLPPLYAELGEIVAGRKKGRESKEERIISMHEGMALQDIALAARVVAAAKEQRIGVELPFIERK